jgi:hypothetical protein
MITSQILHDSLKENFDLKNQSGGNYKYYIIRSWYFSYYAYRWGKLFSIAALLFLELQ